jgi:hypothetical protein
MAKATEGAFRMGVILMEETDATRLTNASEYPASRFVIAQGFRNLHRKDLKDLCASGDEPS